MNEPSDNQRDPATTEIDANSASSDNRDDAFCERLVLLRKDLGLSQKAMNELLAIGKGSWQRYEGGKQMPGGAVIRALAQRGFNTNWILTGDGEMRLPVDHPVNRPTGNPNADNKLKRFGEAAQTILRLCDELGYGPDVSWLQTIQELMVVHDVNEDAARRLLDHLKHRAAEEGSVNRD